jgi:hypothetical protein
MALAGCGGGSSSSSSSSSGNPVPRITSLSPSSAPAGSREVSLSVLGENFLTNSVVRLDDSALTTTYVSRSSLTALIAPADLSSAGQKSVTVFNPAPGGGVSGSASFRITSVTPLEILTSSLPAAHNSREYDYRLRANGGISYSLSSPFESYSWSVVGGSLPDGLSLSESGEISGTAPVVAEDTNAGFEVQVSDLAFEPNTSTQTFNILVRADSLGRNETCSSASPISGGFLDASISPLGDIDVYSFQGTAGNTVEIETYAVRSFSSGSSETIWYVDVYLDTYLELLDSNCNTIAYNDDIDLGNITDSLISDYVLPYTGTYYIRVSDLRGDGRPDFIYQLDLSGAD